MTDLNAKDFIDELRFDIKTNDMIKAHLVMSHFDAVDQASQKMALFELSRAPDEFAIALLVGLMAGRPIADAPRTAFEEIIYSKAIDNPGLLVNLLVKEPRAENRTLLAQVAGELRTAEALPVLLDMLRQEHDLKVLRGTISALGVIGDPSATTPISEFLYSDHAELVIAAIYALGQLGTPTALRRLADKCGADADLDHLILEVFGTSQEPEALERLNATLSAEQASLRIAGKQRLVSLGPKAVPVLLNNLHHDDPDLLIHTLNVLGDIGDEAAVGPIRKLLFSEPKDPNVRFAAYEALGQLPAAKGAFALAQGLHDPVDGVRCAAARAIDRNYNSVLAAGIKNILRDESGPDRPISATIIESGCDRIFLDLIEEEDFRGFALNHLREKAHADIRDHYANLLRAQRLEDLAAALHERRDTVARRGLKVLAVDDSKMILSIYRSMLHKMGHDPILFESPAEAIRQVRALGPDLIFTDLNMPDISGVDLTRAVRQWFDGHRLPIIMVTTESEGADSAAARAAGVNAVLHKPFEQGQLAEAIAAYVSR